MLNQTALKLPSSGIRKFFDIAATRQGCISLGVGEPNFPTPASFCEVGINSVAEGKTGYTQNAGLPELRKLVAEYVRRFVNAEYAYEDEIVITVGASEGIDNTLRAVVNIGDEVLIPEPCFVCYAPLVKMCGAQPVPVPCSPHDGFKLTAEAIENNITPRTKAVILSYPNNPTGGIMTREDLRAIRPAIVSNDLLVISDEIYGGLVYDGEEFASSASLDGMRERTVIVSGFSKYFAMTGWRVGYVCAPREIAKVVLKLHQYSVMCAPTVSQYTALGALSACFEDDFRTVNAMLKSYEKRRDRTLKRLTDMGMECAPPKGTFYAFPYVGDLGMSGEEFAYSLLYEQNVAVVPGSAFGESGKDFVRISYACEDKILEEALDRMEKFTASKRKG